MRHLWGNSVGLGFFSRRIRDVCLESSGRQRRGVQLQDRGRRRQRRIQGEPDHLDAGDLERPAAVSDRHVCRRRAEDQRHPGFLPGAGDRDRRRGRVVRHRGCCSASPRAACRRRPSRTRVRSELRRSLPSTTPRSFSWGPRDRRPVFLDKVGEILNNLLRTDAKALLLMQGVQCGCSASGRHLGQCWLCQVCEGAARQTAASSASSAVPPTASASERR